MRLFSFFFALEAIDFWQSFWTLLPGKLQSFRSAILHSPDKHAAIALPFAISFRGLALRRTAEMFPSGVYLFSVLRGHVFRCPRRSGS